jgi:hypothetical protein
MLTRNHIRVVVPLALLVPLGAVPGPNGWVEPPAAYGQAGAKVAPSDAARQGQSGDEAAIRAVDAEFVRNYNNGDVKALGAMFTDDAEVLDGRRVGR